MTCTVPRKNRRDLNMADVKAELDSNGWIKYTVTTSKTAIDYIVSKTEDGYSSYQVLLTKGSTPAKLQGVYTTPDKALKALLKYIEERPISNTVRRDRDYEERQERRKKVKQNATISNTDDQGKVQQGTPD